MCKISQYILYPNVSKIRRVYRKNIRRKSLIHIWDNMNWMEFIWNFENIIYQRFCIHDLIKIGKFVYKVKFVMYIYIHHTKCFMENIIYVKKHVSLYTMFGLKFLSTYLNFHLPLTHHVHNIPPYKLFFCVMEKKSNKIVVAQTNINNVYVIFWLSICVQNFKTF